MLGATPLVVATANGQADAVALLLQSKADPNLPDILVRRALPLPELPRGERPRGVRPGSEGWATSSSRVLYFIRDVW